MPTSSPFTPDLAHDSDIWRQVVAAMPRLAAYLARRFPDRHGASAQDAVSSAVRVLLDDLDAGEVTFADARAMFCWLGKTAANKLRDQLKKEHLDKRREVVDDGRIAASCDAAVAELDAFRHGLSAEERLVLDDWLEGKPVVATAAENGWTPTRVATLRRRLKRRANGRDAGCTA